MANDITTTAQADRSKAVVAFVSSTDWNLTSAMAEADGVELVPLLARYARGLVPLKEAEADQDMPGRLTTGLGDDLAMLLTKVSPGIGADQADAWIKVMVIALSDLPGRVAREAAQAALHRPMRFANEIEATVRTLAAGIMARHQLACARLREMAGEQDRRRRQAAVTVPPMTDDEIRRMKPEMRALGLGCGALTREQIDRALAGDEQAEAA